MGVDRTDRDVEDGGNLFRRETFVVIKLQEQPVTWGYPFKGLGKLRRVFIVNEGVGRVRPSRWKAVGDFDSRRALFSQKIDGEPSSHESEPTGKAAAPVAPELTELTEVISHNEKKKLLKKILDQISARLRVIETEGLSDRVIDKSRILKDEGVPRGLLPFQTTGKKGFLLFRH